MAVSAAPLPVSSGLLPELLYVQSISPEPQDFDENFADNFGLLFRPSESSESALSVESGIGSSNEIKNAKFTSDEDEDTSSPSSTTSTSPTPEVEAKPGTPILVDEVMNAKIQYQGRDILDLAKNVTGNSWRFQYARLPDNNVSMFMANRSQYHRLGANGLNREFDLASCLKCTFQFPVISPNITFNDDGATTNANAKQTKSNEKAQTDLPSFKMYKHF